tara:strand:+ start:98 stop:295 length:198 start_codon:yes stop_codon:yes gene_type:complete
MNSYANYEWFLDKDLTQYQGKWVAIIDKKIIAFEKDVSKLINKVKKEYPNKKPLITKIRNKLSVL